MSLLTVAQNIADETGFDQPASVIGNTDINVSRLLAQINLAGRVLAMKDWSILQVEHSFNTADGTVAYSLPSDFGRFIFGTGWDQTNALAYKGPLTPQEWQIIKSGGLASTIRPSFRVKPSAAGVNQFNIDPTPSAVETHVFEYITKDWALLAGSGESKMSSDSSTSKIDEDILALDAKWRFLGVQGLSYAEEKFEAERESAKAFGRDGGMRDLDMTPPAFGLDEEIHIKVSAS